MNLPTYPHGAWPSPVAAADVARGSVDLQFPAAVPTAEGVEVWWLEGRPESGGRSALLRRSVSGEVVEVLPDSWNVRSRIIEYGARCWGRVQMPSGGATVFSFWDDQRLYLLPDGHHQPAPLTAAPTDTVTHMYGEPQPGPGASVIAVRETHSDGAVSRCLVQIPLDGSAAADDSAVVVLNDQHHFYAHPRLSPDHRHVSYIAWDHPQMPWDGTVAAVIDLSGDLPGAEAVIAGSTTESVLQPEWADDESVYLVSDRSGWWNLYRCTMDGSMLALAPRDEEFAGPMWELGYTTYGVLADGRLAVTHGRGHERLSVLDPADGTLVSVHDELGWWPHLTVAGTSVVSVVSSGSVAHSVAVVDVASLPAPVDVVRESVSDLPDAAYLPRPEARTFLRPDGHEIHAVVYPPTNPDVAAPAGELPPYLVSVHGGPTAHTSPHLSMDFAFFTSRGIGVIDVNYGGSTGYGRAYRERLKGQWGVVDVEDSVIAAQSLAVAGEADRSRLAIRGGSAGGWTTVAALVLTDAFGAGAAYYPVTDLLPFAEDTHDFESRYLDGLVGPLPEARDRYVERSPLTHLDRLRTPVILLQGDDDKVVPPSQPAAVAQALAGSGIPHAYLLFEGEQHGFRKAESTIAALEAELSFYGQVFGFTPPGVPALPLAY